MKLRFGRRNRREALQQGLTTTRACSSLISGLSFQSFGVVKSEHEHSRTHRLATGYRLRACLPCLRGLSFGWPSHWRAWRRPSLKRIRGGFRHGERAVRAQGMLVHQVAADAAKPRQRSRCARKSVDFFRQNPTRPAAMGRKLMNKKRTGEDFWKELWPLLEYRLGRVLINPERSQTWRCLRYAQKRTSGPAFGTSA